MNYLLHRLALLILRRRIARIEEWCREANIDLAHTVPSGAAYVRGLAVAYESTLNVLRRPEGRDRLRYVFGEQAAKE